MLTTDSILDYLNDKKSTLLARQSFYEFIKQAWHVIEGKTPFVDSWHIKAIAEHLEACYRREIKKLLINIPPRTSKSTIISIMFPVWVWLQNPEEKFLYSSYSRNLAGSHALQSRRLIESNWFAQRWGHYLKISKDKKGTMYFENNKGGCRKITSVAGSATGEGGSFIIADDPNSTGEYNSDAKRLSANEWWDSVWLTRLNNPKKDVMIIVQQRLHEKDISGHVMANDIDNEWVRLIISMEFEEKRKAKTVILPSTNGQIWEDPREKEGELLCEERLSQKEVNDKKREMGSYLYAGQYQQRPSPLGGGHIKKIWFKKWVMPNPPKYEIILQSWDTAFSDKPDASYSACTTWGIWKSNDDSEIQNIILLSMWRGRVGYPELRDRAKRLNRDYKDIGVHQNMYPAIGRVDRCIIEAKATGDPLIRDLRNANIPAIPYIPKGDKNSRVQIVLPYIESGLVWLPTEPKNEDRLMPFADEFIEAVSSFPNTESRDLVDTMTQALSYIRDHVHLRHPKDEYEKEIEQPRKKLY